MVYLCELQAELEWKNVSCFGDFSYEFNQRFSLIKTEWLFTAHSSMCQSANESGVLMGKWLFQVCVCVCDESQERGRREKRYAYFKDSYSKIYLGNKYNQLCPCYFFGEKGSVSAPKRLKAPLDYYKSSQYYS